MNATPPTLRARLKSHPLFKGTGTTVGMTVFFIAYFIVLNNPLFPVTVVPATWLDDVIGFHPWSLIPYASLWFYIAICPSFLNDRRQLWAFAAGCAALAGTGLAIFILFPTAAPAPDIDWSLYPLIQFLKETDSAGNACPSLHAAFAVFTALWFARTLPALGAGLVLQFANFVWAGLIVYSTLATKQHVAIDALYGAILGAWIASLNFIVFPSPHGEPALRRPLFTAIIIIKLCALLLWTSETSTALSLALFFTGGALVLYQIFIPNAGELVRVITRFETSAREVWLTLDDGPDPDDTPRILDLLDQHHARATFFLIGQRAARHPALVAAIRARGHEVAHHTHTHPCGTFWCASPTRVRRELDQALAVFTATSPMPPSRFRAPVGFKNLFLAPALAERGLSCIGWSIRSGDTYALSPVTVGARIASKLQPGAIILMHEGPPVLPSVRVTAIATVLETLTQNGYRSTIPPAESLR